MSTQDDDPIISVLPVHLTNVLGPNVHLHQYPLLTRPLQVPPSAVASGKRIKARTKAAVGRLEVHVPVDTRKEVWNAERSKDLGQARLQDDQEKSFEQQKGKQRENEDPRLGEVRMRSERVPERGDYMLGIVRDGRLHLHAISQAHQLRPTLTYMDVLMKRKGRARADGSDSDSDDGPPPDPDDPTPVQPQAKKEKKPALDAKEVQVAVKKVGEQGVQASQGGLTAVRREMLHLLREEEEEKWVDLEFNDGQAYESLSAFESIFSKNDQELVCKTTLPGILDSITGLKS